MRTAHLGRSVTDCACATAATRASETRGEYILIVVQVDNGNSAVGDN